MEHPKADFDPREQRRIMGLFATGVSVVTTGKGEQGWAMTANSILSLSLIPPLILFAVDLRNAMRDRLTESACFAVNILRRDQEALSQRFATPGPKSLEDVDLRTAATGAPVFRDALAWVDCRLTERLPGGDHEIFIGQIVAGNVASGDPLLFYSGAYRSIAPQESE